MKTITLKNAFKHLSFILLSPFILLFQSCRLGPVVDSGKSNNYYYSRDKKSVIWSPDGNWFELGYHKLEGVDAKSFSVLSAHWSKDKNNVYHHYTAFPLVDINTFQVISEDKGYDANHVYLVREYPSPSTIQIIEGADPETYEIMSSLQFADMLWGDSNRAWAKDKDHVFLRDVIYTPADAVTFEVLTDEFSRDKTNLYILLDTEMHHDVAVIPVNTSELRLLPENKSYIRTESSIFMRKYSFSEKKYKVSQISMNPADTIEYIGGSFLRINDVIYEYGEPITYLEKPIDGLTFRPLDGDNGNLLFFADKNQVYFYDKQLAVLPGANPETIKQIGSQYYTDGNRVYWGSQIVEGADPQTFYFDEKQFRGVDGDELFVREKSLKEWEFEGGEWKRITKNNP
ncbi:DKNYY domain-containing protein [Parabacteroides sp. PF5-9]|uniref:DKNYY domain-containing protein n=1 Tax=Parabacteroides sp. PF5-9 TaxID=1742404 RepID=UPI0024745CF5|nr:DKNYY domain-containing protein [Parabacteroides sp. PF5-9]MDH6357292.1 hypothetical protein [Parabacteroides sp. PF5-9]